MSNDKQSITEVVDTALLKEIQRQNLSEEKDVGKTKMLTLLGLNEGILSVSHLTVAVLTAIRDMPRDKSGLKLATALYCKEEILIAGQTMDDLPADDIEYVYEPLVERIINTYLTEALKGE